MTPEETQLWIAVYVETTRRNTTIEAASPHAGFYAAHSPSERATIAVSELRAKVEADRLAVFNSFSEMLDEDAKP